MIYDVIIVGGSYSGISAGLQLARARRQVLIIDAGRRRNRFASHSRGFLGRDGQDPGMIGSDAQAQLLAYPTAHWDSQPVTRASTSDAGLMVTVENGEQFTARRLVLATGVVDELPENPGLLERWGRRVFHCPYCHGYELDGGPIGVLATSPLAIHHALMLPDWGPTIFLLNGLFEPDADQMGRLARRGVTVIAEPVLSLGGEHADVTLCSAKVIKLAGLFTQPRTHMSSPLGAQLGCEFEVGPTGDFIKVDGMREASVRGVFACGDAALGAGNVATAVGDGALTRVAAHQSLIFR
ncbi:thioredoxin reductase [Pseudomonas sp. PA-6-1D]|uniref:NAD(P)/FAD-dependent oxidoreductase n=1 Tax=Pseudomonas TaxID=286 RepID=UPI001EF0FB38|nr:MULTISPECIES: NAD(P)/FAD-dependent oxidoreductase [Pseudomonas]MCF5143877.1 thioredoxin reductase [Pseudomonas sp. PA-6-3C]MCF5150562.1 thioredoxin reductase [Pseudomonas sp. PA-6-3F]MCF5159010.1 thioredoxin reductase [Pseudomonas sp. PA-6-2E]MCF5178883.1 thioredoxin reductase [Pseudomonas sp. PA-6-1D]MCF5190415.1 thioredoxin reductase [Pseudomonas sp. PA-6-1H]